MVNIYPADIVDDINDRAELQGMALYLQTKFYPPLPAGYAAPALAALKLLNSGDGNTCIIMPADLNPTPRGAIAWADGQHLVAPEMLVEILRLWAHVDLDDDDDTPELAQDRDDVGSI